MAQPIPTVQSELIRDEGLVRVPRRDTLSRWFCGVGCDLKAHALVGKDGLPLSMAPWSDALIYEHLDRDIATAALHLHLGAPWSATLDPIRGRVLLNMTFNMGWRSADGRHGLSTFGPTLALIQAGHYAEAAAHMLASAWAGQVHARAQRLASRMATGDYFATWAPGQVIQAAVNVQQTQALPDAQEDTSLLAKLLHFLKLFQKR